MLEMRPGCECCDRDLPPDSNDARICTFECTFCAACAESLGDRCPNCGGDLVRRPGRPVRLLEKYPASTNRVFAPKKCVDAMGRLLVVLILAGASSLAFGQEVTVGSSFPYYADVSPTKTQTMISELFEANTTGFVTSATFGWSAAHCPGAVKIKFFRPLGFGYFNFVAERGPFDVTDASTLPLPPLVRQTVVLTPPVALQKGDAIAITNLTTCGGPTWSVFGVPLPGTLPQYTFTVDGDVSQGVGPANETTSSFVLYLSAAGPARGLGLLNGRFEVNLTATDPRTGRTTEGTAQSVDDAAGYFALPDFTNNERLPEVTVKMVDATAAPPPFGGAFWFFHASLTDVEYTLTVMDHQTGRVRTYSSAGSHAFCGGGDTNAFPP